MIITDHQAIIQACEPAASITEGQQICRRLADELTASKVPGIGLAANQIGINKRVCILRTPEFDPAGFGYSIEIWLINPKIERLQNPVVFSQEGCLSFPNKTVKTLRYASCRVVDDLNPKGWDFNGLRAIVAQHEIAHTNSHTMYDSEWDRLRPKMPCPCDSGKPFKLCCKPKAKPF